MDQSVSAATSIQDTNAALMAQHKAAMAAAVLSKGTSAQTPNFASELQSVQRTELPAPTSLYTNKVAQAQAPQTVVAPEAVVSEADTDIDTDANAETCAAPKISRSARLACAEKATQVQESSDDFGVDDFVDMINPLQHIPIVGTIYRELTGDTIKPEVQVAGSIGFGVLTGSIVLSAVAGIASAAMEQSTGKEPLVQVADALFGDTVQTPDALTEAKVVVADAAPTMAAKATPPSTPSTAAAAPTTTAQVAENAQNAAPVAAAKTARTAQQTAAAPVMASAGSARMGNIIYTSPMLKSAAKVGKTVTVTPVKTAGTSDAASVTQADNAKTPLDDTTLGTLIHEQAKAREAGHTLPPELVQDMMTLALDKYKAANMASANTGAAAMMP